MAAKQNCSAQQCWLLWTILAFNGPPTQAGSYRVACRRQGRHRLAVLGRDIKFQQSQRNRSSRIVSHSTVVERTKKLGLGLKVSPCPQSNHGLEALLLNESVAAKNVTIVSCHFPVLIVSGWCQKNIGVQVHGSGSRPPHVVQCSAVQHAHGFGFSRLQSAVPPPLFL